MINGIGGFNLYIIDICLEVRIILKISIEGIEIFIILRCFFGVVLEFEVNNIYLGVIFFLSALCSFETCGEC